MRPQFQELYFLHCQQYIFVTAARGSDNDGPAQNSNTDAEEAGTPQITGSTSEAALTGSAAEEVDVVEVVDVTSERKDIAETYHTGGVAEVVLIGDEVSENSLDDAVASVIAQINAKGYFNPVAILRSFQETVVQGRPLDIEDPTGALEGESSLIFVDREKLLETGLDEISQIKNLRLTLEVQFYGEVGILVMIP